MAHAASPTRRLNKALHLMEKAWKELAATDLTQKEWQGVHSAVHAVNQALKRSK